MIKKLPIKYIPILGIVTIILIIGFYMALENLNFNKNIIIENLTSPEGVSLKNIHYTQNDPDEGMIWELDAKKVNYTKNKQNMSFNDFLLKLNPSDSTSFNLKGEQGEYKKDSGEIDLYGNLRGKTSDGYQLETEHLLYKQKAGSLETNENVRITGPSLTVTGKGLLYNLKNKNLKITSNVIARIKGDN